jgi:hypothetical protein
MSLADDVVVRRQVTVDAPIERAFAVFTERFGDCKPKEHNMLGVPIAETRFEPHVGGHIYDRGEDGSECRWARVLAYEPRTGSCSAGTSARTGMWKRTRPRRARSRSPSWPRRRRGRGWSSCTATSTGTGPAGKAWPPASAMTVAGRCTSPDTPSSSPGRRRWHRSSQPRPGRAVNPGRLGRFELQMKVTGQLRRRRRRARRPAPVLNVGG